MTDQPRPQQTEMFPGMDLSATMSYVEAEVERIARAQELRWEAEAATLPNLLLRQEYLTLRRKGKHLKAAKLRATWSGGTA